MRHKLATGRGGDDLVFGTTATVAPDRSTIRRRALKAWGWRDKRSREEHGWASSRALTQMRLGWTRSRPTRRATPARPT